MRALPGFGGRRRIPEAAACGGDRVRRSCRGIPLQRLFRRAGADLAGLHRSAGADLRRQAFRAADDVAGAGGNGRCRDRWSGPDHLICAVASRTSRSNTRIISDINRPTSTGQRLEYWTQALGWIREAPLIGHGTGSTKQLFENAADRQAGSLGAEASATPTTRRSSSRSSGDCSACIVLYAMWFFHYRLFRGSKASSPGSASPSSFRTCSARS